MSAGRARVTGRAAAAAGTPLTRVRRICMALPGASEKLSHGEPTWFAHRRVFAMFANNHHDDGHVAVWLPAPPGLQEQLIESSPRAYFEHESFFPDSDKT